MAPGDSRPEYYDFDLFAAGEGSRALDDRVLWVMAYTVFDTETTGIDPAGGDEILSIGATRIVNGRLLRGECFDQLVDPQRSIPEAGIPIDESAGDGARPADDRRGAAGFHAFASETVLVGHNVAFDMRFLKLKEAASGVRFDQPVLDTSSGRAWCIRASRRTTSKRSRAPGRYGVGPPHCGRRALVTAEEFPRGFPRLRQQGILTLGQAREAAQETDYSRLRY